MNSARIKACVACYFRYKRQCNLVSFERPINTYFSKPDIFVINKQRRLIEIEVKISMADFKNDIKKRIWGYRDKMPNLYPMPHQFYYAVPKSLEEKSRALLQSWKEESNIYGKVGLLVVKEHNNRSLLGYNDVYVSITAPTNKSSKKIPVKDLITMVKNQSATLCSEALKNAKLDMVKKPKKPKKTQRTSKIPSSLGGGVGIGSS